MIRIATKADVPRIVELGSLSLMNGPYKDIIKDTPQRSATLAMQVIEGNNGKVFLFEEDGQVHGLLGFVIYPHYFTGELTANEIMWYVEPQYRKGGSALQLLWTAETEAKKMGAKYMGFTAPTADVAAIYARFGYKQIEISFGKEL